MGTAKRSEIIFIYDLKWANPNGDPMDLNKPRIDIETGINFVTDVRLKRTIRDELYNSGHEILIRDTVREDGSLADGKYRAAQFIPENMQGYTDKDFQELEKQLNQIILNKCLDVRLFGCTLPFEFKYGKKTKSGSVTYTGPVQFKMGYSMHPVKCELVKGTGAFASGEEKNSKTFRQEYILPYSLILFYGIINDRAAKTTGLTEDEIALLLKAMWDGTKNLISRTKAGQTPRVLIRVVYKDGDFHIGELDKGISFTYGKPGEIIRDIADGAIDFSDLLEKLGANARHIEKVELRLADRLPVRDGVNIPEAIQKLGIEVRTF
ncbi:MAG TPA: type I-B CRISPR-associated protein Cas7/Csh2 [Bacillota bacterium]|nr:type I-B CRISPR-associated protein Cas7/Csh2 [Clostridiales bacterium]HQC82818.1 type I-B CRISPR-associated protein Cas7/Csh2 [Bacillota bacterium]